MSNAFSNLTINPKVFKQVQKSSKIYSFATYMLFIKYEHNKYLARVYYFYNPDNKHGRAAAVPFYPRCS